MVKNDTKIASHFKAAVFLLCFLSTPLWTAIAEEISGAIDFVEVTEAKSQHRHAKNSVIDINSIDINSKLLIRFNKDLLTEYIARGAADIPPYYFQVLDSLRLIPDVLNELLISDFKELNQINSKDEYVAEVKRISNRIRTIERPLQTSIRLRMFGDMEPTENEEDEYWNYLEPLGDPNQIFAINWDTIGYFVNQEIIYWHAKIDSILDEAEPLGIEVTSQLRREDGSVSQVHVPGYDSIMECRVSKVQKMNYSISETEKQLHYAYDNLAHGIRELQDSGKSVLAATAETFGKQFTQYEALVSSVETIFNSTKSIEDIFSFWLDSNALSGWIDNAKILASPSPSLINKLNNMPIGEINTGLQTLDRYYSLFANINEIKKALSKPEGAMEAILSLIQKAVKQKWQLETVRFAFDPDRWNWENYFGGLTGELIDTLKNGRFDFNGQNLGRDFGSLKHNLNTIKSELGKIEEISQSFSKMLVNLVNRPVIEAMADLSAPESRVLNLDENINSHINLTKICGKRSKGDLLYVKAKLYRGDTELESHTAVFMIDILGWHSDAYASLAFTQRVKTGGWIPYPSYSWILGFERRTPNRLLEGLGTIFNGIGISTVGLDFSDEKEFEIGFAPTISLLNNRIFMGYGWNMQAGNNSGFFYISVRLLDISGPFGGGDTRIGRGTD